MSCLVYVFFFSFLSKYLFPIRLKFFHFFISSSLHFSLSKGCLGGYIEDVWDFTIILSFILFP